MAMLQFAISLSIRHLSSMTRILMKTMATTVAMVIYIVEITILQLVLLTWSHAPRWHYSQKQYRPQ